MSKEFIIFSLSFIGGFLIRSVFSHLFIFGTYVKLMQDLERKFLLLGINFLQWRAHSLKILELTYENYADEKQDPEKNEEFKKIKNKIEEKFEKISDQYVTDLKKILPYKPEYNNFEEAIKYLKKNLDNDKEG